MKEPTAPHLAHSVAAEEVPQVRLIVFVNGTISRNPGTLCLPVEIKCQCIIEPVSGKSHLAQSVASEEVPQMRLTVL